MEGVVECTGASIVGDTLLIMQKLTVWSFALGSSSPKEKAELNSEDHENFLYDFSFITSIFRVNVHESPEKL